MFRLFQKTILENLTAIAMVQSVFRISIRGLNTLIYPVNNYGRKVYE